MSLRHRAYELRGASEGKVKDDLEELDTSKQDVIHRFFKRQPVARELAEGEVVFALVSSTFRLYTKLRGSIFFVNLTAA